MAQFRISVILIPKFMRVVKSKLLRCFYSFEIYIETDYELGVFIKFLFLKFYLLYRHIRGI